MRGDYLLLVGAEGCRFDELLAIPCGSERRAETTFLVLAQMQPRQRRDCSAL